MEPIQGVTLEKYADLLAKMSDCGEDNEACYKIAENDGVSRSDWDDVKSGWQAKMMDPSDMGKTSMAFMPFYQAALDRKNSGQEPCTLEEFVRIHADMSFRKDTEDSSKKIPYEIVLKENGLTTNKWGEFNSYWTPLVSTAGETHDKYSALIQQNSDRILGIVR